MKKLAGYLRDNDWTPALALLVLCFWLAVRLDDPFWRDEGITYWIASGSWPELADRARRFASWMFFHGALSKLFFALPGPRELTLRLPSVLAALAALRLAFLIGRKAGGDALSGWLAALCLASLRMFEFHAAEARAYAMTLAFSLAALHSFMRFAEEGKAGHAALWAAFSALAFYSHMMAGLATAAQALAGLRLLRAKAGGLRRLFGGLALCALLLAPLAGVIASFPARSVVFLGRPEPWDILKLLFPLEIAGGLHLGLAAAFLSGAGPKLRRARDRFARPHAAALAATCLLPAAALFLVSYFTEFHVFISRYALSSFASAAVLAALAVRALEPRRARLLAAAGIALFSCARAVIGPAIHPEEDWRGVAAAVNAALRPGDAVVLQSPLVESADRAAPDDPDRRAYLSSILSPYPVNSSYSVYPVFVAEEDGEYSRLFVLEAARDKSRLFFLTAESDRQAELFGAAALKAGFSRAGLSRHGPVRLLLFERTAADR